MVLYKIELEMSCVVDIERGSSQRDQEGASKRNKSPSAYRRMLSIHSGDDTESEYVQSLSCEWSFGNVVCASLDYPSCRFESKLFRVEFSYLFRAYNIVVICPKVRNYSRRVSL